MEEQRPKARTEEKAAAEKAARARTELFFTRPNKDRSLCRKPSSLDDRHCMASPLACFLNGNYSYISLHRLAALQSNPICLFATIPIKFSTDSQVNVHRLVVLILMKPPMPQHPGPLRTGIGPLARRLIAPFLNLLCAVGRPPGSPGDFASCSPLLRPGSSNRAHTASYGWQAVAEVSS